MTEPTTPARQPRNRFAFPQFKLVALDTALTSVVLVDSSAEPASCSCTIQTLTCPRRCVTRLGPTRAKGCSWSLAPMVEQQQHCVRYGEAVGIRSVTKARYLAVCNNDHQRQGFRNGLSQHLEVTGSHPFPREDGNTASGEWTVCRFAPEKRFGSRNGPGQDDRIRCGDSVQPPMNDTVLYCSRLEVVEPTCKKTSCP